MKLSMATGALFPYFETGTDLMTGLKVLRDSGFCCLDFEITTKMLDDQLEKNALSLKEILASLGLTAYQGHAPMYNPLNPPEDINCQEVYTRTLYFCKLAGIPQVVIHPGARKDNTREEFFEGNVAFYKSLIPVAEEYGMGVLIENIGNYADPYYLWNGTDLREMIDRVDHLLFSACWDVGHAHHFWPEDGNQYDSIMALGDKLKALHVHENCGYFDEPREHNRIDMHTVPYGAGYRSTLSYDEILQALKDIDYKGTFNFEVVFPARKANAVFNHKGQKITKLQMLPLSLWQKFNAVIYDMGRYMLETYDMYEE